MAKKFAEHSGLNLTKVNDDILEMWREKNVFWRSVEDSRVLPLPTDIRVSTTFWLVPSRTPSTAIRR